MQSFSYSDNIKLSHLDDLLSRNDLIYNKLKQQLHAITTTNQNIQLNIDILKPYTQQQQTYHTIQQPYIHKPYSFTQFQSQNQFLNTNLINHPPNPHKSHSELTIKPIQKNVSNQPMLKRNQQSSKVLTKQSNPPTFSQCSGSISRIQNSGIHSSEYQSREHKLRQIKTIAVKTKQYTEIKWKQNAIKNQPLKNNYNQNGKAKRSDQRKDKDQYIEQYSKKNGFGGYEKQVNLQQNEHYHSSTVEMEGHTQLQKMSYQKQNGDSNDYTFQYKPSTEKANDTFQRVNSSIMQFQQSNQNKQQSNQCQRKKTKNLSHNNSYKIAESRKKQPNLPQKNSKHLGIHPKASNIRCETLLPKNTGIDHIIFIPFNKLYCSSIIEVRQPNTLLFTRRSKNGQQMPSINNTRYKYETLFTDEQQLVNNLLQTDNNSISIVGGAQTLKKKLHAQILLFVLDRLQIILQQNQQICLLTINHQEITSVEANNHHHDVAVEVAYDRLHHLQRPFQQFIKMVIGRSNRKECQLLRMTKVNLYVGNNTLYHLFVVSTNRYEPSFISCLDTEKVVWSLNPLLKNYEETQLTLQAMKKAKTLARSNKVDE